MKLVISPHLDDAVLSCGSLLAANPGTEVLTVFAGRPKTDRRASEWDRKCGQKRAWSSIRDRRERDTKALAKLGARPSWLSYVPRSYGGRVGLKSLVRLFDVLLRNLEIEGDVFIPLGLKHPEHVLVSDACLPIFFEASRVRLFLYEDQPYRVQGYAAERLKELRKRGYGLRLAKRVPAARIKLDALHCYGQQVGQLARKYRGYSRLDAERGEVFYRVT